MILITGGAYQGKRTFACRLLSGRTGHPRIADGETGRTEEIFTADIWDHFPLWVRRQRGSEEEAEEEIDEILARNPELVIITQELGCGLVPVDAGERAYREEVGRLGCRLARQAREVWLVTCGIPMKIKGDSRC